MSAQASGFPLAVISLDHSSPTPLYRQVYESLSQAILNGKLSPGLRLPSTRDLANFLDVSRNTVMNAFEQLIAEGYLDAIVGSGTYVAHTLPDDLLHARAHLNTRNPAPAASRRLSLRGAKLAQTQVSAGRYISSTHVFAHGVPAIEEFPFDIWSRLITRHYRHASGRLFLYGEPAGYAPLREAIATYLRAARAVNCEASQVIICNGSQQALDLATRLLLDPGATAWIEDPGYRGAYSALVGAGANVMPVPVDGEGLDIQCMDAQCKPDLIYVTPSHQFPLGVTMSLTRRLHLLHHTDAWILEDDYDSEFRYSGRPIPALQGLDTAGRVIYLGTFSKVLFPALRVGYLIVPPHLTEAFSRAQAVFHRGVSAVVQAALADFITEGHFARHIRRMRVLYDERRTIFLNAVEREVGGFLEIGESDTGMHTIGWLPDGYDDVITAQYAADIGIETVPLSQYAIHPLARAGLVLGYAAASSGKIDDGMKRLAKALLPD